MITLVFVLLTSAVVKTETCEDKFVDLCPGNKELCGTSFMDGSCMKTCGLCSNKESCKDDVDVCYQNKEYCGKIPYMDKHCKLTCGLCKRTEPSKPPKTRQPLQSSSCGKDVLVSQPTESNNSPDSDDIIKRIIGGEVAWKHKWIWQGMLYDQGVFQCGGTLITPDIFLTAAHCTDKRKKEGMVIKMGYHDRNKDSGGQEIGVLAVKQHKYYERRTKNVLDDIALIKVKHAFKLSSSVGIACLPDEYSHLPSKSECYVTGWGLTTAHGENPVILQQVRMPIVPGKDCKDHYPHISDRQFCGGELSSTVSACAGDSGGPFVCKVNGRWVLEGIVSFGHHMCEAEEGFTVFTKVSKYIPWIGKNMNILKAL